MLRQCLNKKKTHEETECACARSVRPPARKKIQNEKKKELYRENVVHEISFFL